MSHRVVRYDRGTGFPALGSTQCRVCTLPQVILDALDGQRRHFGDSVDQLSSFFSERLPEWVAEGLLPAGTLPISRSSFHRHYANHTTDPPSMQDSKTVEVEVLRDALNRRAHLYTQAYTLFSQVYENAQRKVEEWGQLLEAERSVREEYYTQSIQRYLSARAEHQQRVLEAREAGEPEPIAPPEASRPSRLPILPGLEDEEERMLRMLGQLRQYASEAAKIISYEEGFQQFIRIELEVFLRETAQGSLQDIMDAQDGLELIVPRDKHDRLRELLKAYMEKQHLSMRVRFKELLRSISQFSRQTRT